VGFATGAARPLPRSCGRRRGRRRSDPAVGTSRPVTLARTQKSRLLLVVEGWLWEVSTTGLPDGIFELRNAVIDERDAGELDG
jgi:hypothetical protein